MKERKSGTHRYSIAHYVTEKCLQVISPSNPHNSPAWTNPGTVLEKKTKVKLAFLKKPMEKGAWPGLEGRPLWLAGLLPRSRSRLWVACLRLVEEFLFRQFLSHILSQTCSLSKISLKILEIKKQPQA